MKLKRLRIKITKLYQRKGFPDRHSHCLPEFLYQAPFYTKTGRKEKTFASSRGPSFPTRLIHATLDFMIPRVSPSVCLLWLFLSPFFPTDAESQELTLSQAKIKFVYFDHSLNTAYQEAKSNLPEYLFETIRREQRDWIAYRDRRAEAAARFDGGAKPGTEKTNPEYWNAMAYLTETRVEILKAWRKTDSFTKTWEGAWIDGYGGILRIAEGDDGSLTFTCSVVRGPSYHLGDIAGTAKTNETTARFTTQVEGEETETWLTFLPEGDGRLRVIGENTQYFHGARAYFDGKYLRVRELTKEDREAMKEER